MAPSDNIVDTIINLQAREDVLRRETIDLRRTEGARKESALKLDALRVQLRELKELLHLAVDRPVSEADLATLATRSRQEARHEVAAIRPTVVASPPVTTDTTVGPVAGIDYERLKLDFIYFCEHVLTIAYRPGMQPGLLASGPLILTYAQRLVVAVLYDIMLVQNLPLRVIILKSRQLGCTTLLLAFEVWLLFTRPHYNVMFIIDKDPHFRTKRKMIIDWVEAAAAFECFPGIEQRDDKILFLTNKSHLFFESAESDNPGTSEMLHGLHESEKSKWPRGRAKTVKESILPGIPQAPGTFHVDECTAVGLDEFYFRWRRAEQGQEDIGGVKVVPIFLPWYLSPEYTVNDVPPGFAFLDDDEEVADVTVDAQTGEERKFTESQYAAFYKLSPGQVLWRRRQIKITFEGNRASFDKEYPTTAEHAWQAAGGGYFPKSLVKRARSWSEQNQPLRRARVVDVGGYDDVSHEVLYTQVRPRLIEDHLGELEEWEDPRPGGTYFCGVDVAEGKTVESEDGEVKSDQTIFYIEDEWGYLVALYQCRLRPDESWLPLLLVLLRWGQAWVNGERNSAGLTLLSSFIKTGYPRMLVRPQPEGAPVFDRTWTTVSPINRETLLADYRSCLAADYRRCRSAVVAAELANFVVVMSGRKPRAQARAGCHDDTIFAGVHCESIRRKFGGTLMLKEQALAKLVDETGTEVVAGFRLYDPDLIDQLEGDVF